MRGQCRYPRPRKDDLIQVRVTKEDRDLVEQWAREKGLTAGAYIRSIIFEKQQRELVAA